MFALLYGLDLIWNKPNALEVGDDVTGRPVPDSTSDAERTTAGDGGAAVQLQTTTRTGQDGEPGEVQMSFICRQSPQHDTTSQTTLSTIPARRRLISGTSVDPAPEEGVACTSWNASNVVNGTEHMEVMVAGNRSVLVVDSEIVVRDGFMGNGHHQEAAVDEADERCISCSGQDGTTSDPSQFTGEETQQLYIAESSRVCNRLPESRHDEYVTRIETADLNCTISEETDNLADGDESSYQLESASAVSQHCNLEKSSVSGCSVAQTGSAPEEETSGSDEAKSENGGEQYVLEMSNCSTCSLPIDDNMLSDNGTESEDRQLHSTSSITGHTDRITDADEIVQHTETDVPSGSDGQANEVVEDNTEKQPITADQNDQRSEMDKTRVSNDIPTYDEATQHDTAAAVSAIDDSQVTVAVTDVSEIKHCHLPSLPAGDVSNIVVEQQLVTNQNTATVSAADCNDQLLLPFSEQDSPDNATCSSSQHLPPNVRSCDDLVTRLSSGVELTQSSSSESVDQLQSEVKGQSDKHGQLEREGQRAVKQPSSSDSTGVQLLTELTTMDTPTGNVFGICHLFDRIFIACRQSNKILVYLDSEPFSRLDDLEVSGMLDPWDLVSCHALGCLYVTDLRGQCVWRVTVKADGSVSSSEQLMTNVDRPWTLSVTGEGRLTLVTGTGAVQVIGPDGQLLSDVVLPPTIQHPMHVLELSSGHYLVSHGLLNTNHQVCEVRVTDSGSEVLRTFGCGPDESERLREPWHMAALGGRLLCIADSRNGRLLVVDSEMRLRSTVDTKHAAAEASRTTRWARSRPWRVCYEPNRNLLLVGCYNGGVIIYGTQQNE